ncbi:amino acid synthesis family protein [Dinoroseobacter sp. S375]|uniref:amino acid synthesis family protein n=1 Tax=Dinoroseobacter sp. S375 TaxID=3415136 RepID=UPI003C7C48C3
MDELRKTLLLREVIRTDPMGTPCSPVVRVAALAVLRNPLAGQVFEDLTPLFALGADAGALLAAEAVAALGAPAVSYGKAALVGVAGDMEHGGAVVHPRLGAPMRAASEGGAAVIPSNVKLAAMGTAIDLPLGHKDDAWSFDHFDTMTVSVPDGPRPDEIVLALAYATAGRPKPRCPKGG